MQGNIDRFVKSPSAALRFNFVVAAHLVSALHSSVFARLASGAFYDTLVLMAFYEIFIFHPWQKGRPDGALFVFLMG